MGTSPAELDERSRMEAEIRAVEKAYDEAWQAADIERLLLCLEADAVLVNPYGERSRGQVEIRQELTRVLHGVARGSLHTSLISSIELITPDVAIVDGEASVRILGEPEGSTVLHHSFTDLLVRRDGRWLIAHIRAYGPIRRADAPYRRSVSGAAADLTTLGESGMRVTGPEPE